MWIDELPLPVQVSKEEFEDLKSLQLKRRIDFTAWFSTNPRGEIWPDVTHSYHRDGDRTHVRGENAFLDDLADLLVAIRPEGGRFFVDASGAMFRPSDATEVHFAAFQFVSYPDRSPLRRFISRVPPDAREAHERGICEQATCDWCLEELDTARRRSLRQGLELCADHILGVAGKRKKRWQL